MNREGHWVERAIRVERKDEKMIRPVSKDLDSQIAEIIKNWQTGLLNRNTDVLREYKGSQYRLHRHKDGLQNFLVGGFRAS